MTHEARIQYVITPNDVGADTTAERFVNCPVCISAYTIAPFEKMVRLIEETDVGKICRLYKDKWNIETDEEFTARTWKEYEEKRFANEQVDMQHYGEY